MTKLPVFSRNLQKSVSLCKYFSWVPPLNHNEYLYRVICLCKVYNVSFSFWLKGGAQENYLYNDTEFCRFLLKMENFAIPLPVSSQIFMLELFAIQNLIWIWIAWYLAKVKAKLCLLNSKFYFHPLTGPNHAILA
jgi:hypothetical protein